MLKTVPNIGDVTENGRVGSSKGPSLHRNIRKKRKEKSSKNCQNQFYQKTVKGLTRIMKTVSKVGKLCDIFICPFPTLLPVYGQS